MLWCVPGGMLSCQQILLLVLHARLSNQPCLAFQQEPQVLPPPIPHQAPRNSNLPLTEKLAKLRFFPTFTQDRIRTSALTLALHFLIPQDLHQGSDPA